ncbi:MAG: hypothetical protein ACOX52_16430 [Verrucomicrobiota bacterium]
MDSSSGKGRPHQMNRQDAKDAKEIENLDMFVIGASIGYELHASNGLTGACPKKHPQKLGPETYTYTAKRYTFTYTMMRRVRVRVRVGRVADPSDHCRDRNFDEIGIDPSPGWHLDRSGHVPPSLPPSPLGALGVLAVEFPCLHAFH